jgi:geranylgeranyl diphosphate synthase type I
LIHNFSLIHDDIEDSSPTRRGRATLWAKHGVPQAINTGDTLFAIASLALLELEKTCPAKVALNAFRIAHQTTLDLTKGQYLDMAYENLRSLPLEGYWPMIKGKTAALLAACPQMGALVAGAQANVVEAYRTFGQNLGLAFQVQDDILGIWGSPEVTGKSTAIDLQNGKKSLPVLFGLQQDGAFAQRWLAGSLHESEIVPLAEQLAREGALDYAQNIAGELTAQALAALASAQPHGSAGQALFELASQLLKRRL